VFINSADYWLAPAGGDFALDLGLDRISIHGHQQTAFLYLLIFLFLALHSHLLALRYLRRAVVAHIN